jgi:hypothetical protein
MTNLNATSVVRPSGDRAQLTAELASAELLQNISTQLIHENRVEALYEKIVDAAVMLMRSDYGTMQRHYPQRGRGGQLRLLAHRGFPPKAAKAWHRQMRQRPAALLCGPESESLSMTLSNAILWQAVKP